MPFIDSPDTELALPKAMGSPEFDTEPTSTFKEQMRAAYRLENVVGSYFSKEAGLPDSVVTNVGFNPYDLFTDEEKQDSQFIENAILADSAEEVDAVRRQTNREKADRQLLAEGGIAATVIPVVASPINLIPVGGTAYATYRGGASILKGAAATSAVAAGTTAAEESLLLHDQLTRTYGEAAVNIGGATFLGGIIGAAPIALRGMLEDNGIDSQRLFDDMDEVMNPEPDVVNGLNASAPLGDKSMGAAQVMDDPIVRGKLARAVTKFIGFDPLSRTITSEEKLTRVASARLAENPIDVEGGSVRQSVETSIKNYDTFFYDGFKKHDVTFKEYRTEGGNLNRKEFNSAVSKAIRNGSENIHIQKSADDWDNAVYQPVKKRAIEAKLLADDVDVTTAERYLNRVWNKEKIIRNLPEFNRKVSNWLRTRQDIDADEAEYLANEIAGRIASTPDGKLPYDYKIGENSAGSSKSVAGVFKARSFDIDDSLVEDFLENDIEELAYRYIKSAAPDIELIKEFGDAEMTGELKAIDMAYIEKIKAAQEAGNAKLAKQLAKDRVRDSKNLSAMRDRIKGTYGIPSDPNNIWMRAARVARDLNYMRLLGGVVASSVPDVARIVAAEGIVNTFRHGLAPLAANLKTFKVAASEAKEWGVGMDAVMGGRAEIMADVADYSKGGTAFERGVRTAAQKFSSINLMNQWTAGVKQLHAVVLQTRLINDMKKGIYDPRMSQLGIDEGTYGAITQQMNKHAREIDGVWVANTKDWSSPDLVWAWKGAMRKESDRVIIMPGQEKPLFMSNELGKTMLQFKTFMFSATQRVLISTLQNQDKYTMQGVLSLVSMGAMAYTFKQWDAGREITDDPKALVIEGIDRSGVLGILMEVNNTLEKISSNNLGMRPVLGISAPASRYASRSIADTVLGPSFGLLNDFAVMGNALSNGQEWAESDTRTFRRLLPMQNLSILRQGFDVIESEVNEAIGVQ